MLSEISQRNKLFKRHKRHPTSTSWVDYKRQRNKVTSLKRNALKMFCCDAFGEKESPFCQLVLVKTYKASSSLTAVVLFPTLGVYVAEVFSDYFANNIQVELRSDSDYTNHPSIKALSSRRFSSEFNHSPVSSSYVRN